MTSTTLILHFEPRWRPADIASALVEPVRAMQAHLGGSSPPDIRTYVRNNPTERPADSTDPAVWLQVGPDVEDLSASDYTLVPRWDLGIRDWAWRGHPDGDGTAVELSIGHYDDQSWVADGLWPAAEVLEGVLRGLLATEPFPAPIRSGALCVHPGYAALNNQMFAGFPFAAGDARWMTAFGYRTVVPAEFVRWLGRDRIEGCMPEGGRLDDVGGGRGLVCLPRPLPELTDEGRSAIADVFAPVVSGGRFVPPPLTRFGN